jgi:hypothetical protein
MKPSILSKDYFPSSASALSQAVGITCSLSSLSTIVVMSNESKKEGRYLFIQDSLFQVVVIQRKIKYQ